MTVLRLVPLLQKSLKNEMGLEIFILLKSAISRQAKANKFSLVFWLNEIVPRTKDIQSFPKK